MACSFRVLGTATRSDGSDSRAQARHLRPEPSIPPSAPLPEVASPTRTQMNSQAIARLKWGGTSEPRSGLERHRGLHPHGHTLPTVPMQRPPSARGPAKKEHRTPEWVQQSSALEVAPQNQRAHGPPAARRQAQWLASECLNSRQVRSRQGPATLALPGW